MTCPESSSVCVAQPGWEPGVSALELSPYLCQGLSLSLCPSPRAPDEDGEEEAAPGPRQAHDSLYRVHMPSLYSCGSSYGSETSIPAAAHTVSNAPVTEYM